MSALHSLAPRPALALALLSSFSLAQTGPFRDGELLVQAPSSLGSGPALYRIDPETGHGAEFLSGVGQGGWAGSIAFDAFRGALLVNRALPPDGPFTTKLWLVQHDGTKAPIAALNGLALRALASTGDGRVYFQQNHTYSTPSQPIQYLDASDTVRTLLDAANAAPFS
ncbi:MAG: hypothetical protein JNM84_05120, partial [Planctomycetes bacterium]|nr:hypothetical protein [Planctomycetota bacterium]